MEYGMNSTLKVHFKDLDTDGIESIEFIFKQENKNDAEAIKYVNWQNGVEVDEVFILDGDLTNYYIPFTKAETFKFKPGKKFYIDARIHYANTFDNPHVAVMPIDMLSGLFGVGDP